MRNPSNERLSGGLNREEELTMPSKYVEYNKSHHSGGTPEERLKYRTLNSGKGDASFNSRNHPKPDYVISEPRAWANIHKASQSAPPDDVLQPGRGLRGLLEPGD